MTRQEVERMLSILMEIAQHLKEVSNQAGYIVDSFIELNECIDKTPSGKKFLRIVDSNRSNR